MAVTPYIMNPERVAHLQSRFEHLLSPLGRLYARLMRLRSGSYAAGRLPSWRPPVPCISVGNISWGGTGKTPVVSWLLEWARGENMSPAVLTRGYGGRPPRHPYPVDMQSPAREAGDEPLLLKRINPEAAIIVDPNRIRGGKLACEKFRTDLLILDDGFQHLGVRRDVDLCLFSSHDLEAGWDRVIPAGSWREDASALNRADAFLINTTADDDGCLEIMAHIKLAGMGKPLFFFRISAHGVANALTGAAMPSLEKIRYLLVTGIAIPEKVAQTCRTDLKEQPIRHLIYPDHHAFTRRDWETISQTAEASRCTHILCTPKDVVKLSSFADDRLWVPQLSTSFFTRGPQTFNSWLQHRLVPESPHAKPQTESA